VDLFGAMLNVTTAATSTAHPFVLDGGTGQISLTRRVLTAKPDWVDAVPDLDGDEFDDIVSRRRVNDATVVEAMRGEDAALLWSRTIAQEISRVDDVGDLTSDGVDDIAAWGWSGSSDRTTIIDGATGSTWWQGPGQFAGKIRLGERRGVVLTDENWTGHHYVVSVKGLDTSAGVIYEAVFDCDNRIVEPAGDLNADGSDDVVVMCTPVGSHGSSAWMTYAISGQDGTILWQKSGGVVPLAASVDGFGADVATASGTDEVTMRDGLTLSPIWSAHVSWGNYPFSAGDVDGDGRAEIAIKSPGAMPLGGSPLFFELLSGRDGTVLWGP